MYKNKMISDIIGWFDEGYIDEFVIKQSTYSEEQINNMSTIEKESFEIAQSNGNYEKESIRERFIESLNNEDEAVISELYQGFYQLQQSKKLEDLSNWLKTPVTVVPYEVIKYDRLREKYRNSKG